jgi:hypothetical protein
MSGVALFQFFVPLGCLLGLALLAVRLPGRGRGLGSLDGWDALYALVCGLIVALVAAFGAGPLALEGGAVTGADFQEYCATVASVRGDPLDWHYAMRSRFPALVPGLLAGPFGVLDGLVLGSLLGSALLGASLYLWGRGLHGRVAGCAAAALSLGLPALALAGRMLSFYPLIAGLLALATALATLAFSQRRPWALLLGGIGVGLALLADSVGLLWALPLLLLVVIAALWAPRKRWPLRLALVLLPVALSFGVGRWAYAHSHSLELQLAIMVRANLPTQQAIEAEEGGYRWGWSNPLAVPATLLRVARRSGGAGERIERRDPSPHERDPVAPWLPLAAAGAVAAMVALRRRPGLILALGLGCLPWAAMLQRAASMEPSLRFLLLSMPFVPLVLGVGLAGALVGAHAGPDLEAEPVSLPGMTLRPVLAAVVVGLLLGLGFSPLSPRWEGHKRWQAVNDGPAAQRYARRGIDRPHPANEGCIEAMRLDVERGVPEGSQVYGGLE